MKKAKRFIISGGGTGGHIFPAIAIANALKERYPEAQFLFIGAEGRMEQERVPEAGYNIVCLPVAGFDRRNIFRNIGVLVRLRRSLALAKKTIKHFRPHVVIGVGGYASGPALRAASRLGIPTLVQEQNSYAGVTNKLLAKKASKICVAYEGMEQFFPQDKIVITGNPVRQGLEVSEEKRQKAIGHFGLHPDRKTILVLGGSLGARTINESILAQWEKLAQAEDVQLLWQTGALYSDEINLRLGEKQPAAVHPVTFIREMELAYSVADLVISRAGAGSISEFALLGKPVILVPSPNVAEDHQTRNAMALVNNDAAMMIPDKHAVEQLIPLALELIRDTARLETLGLNIKKMAIPDSAKRIVDEVERLLRSIDN